MPRRLGVGGAARPFCSLGERYVGHRSIDQLLGPRFGVGSDPRVDGAAGWMRKEGALGRRSGTSGSDSSPMSSTGGATVKSINGAGATFPYPIYSKWNDAYFKKLTSSSITNRLARGAASLRSRPRRLISARPTPLGSERTGRSRTCAVSHRYGRGGAGCQFARHRSQSIASHGPDCWPTFISHKVTRWDDSAVQAVNPDVKLPARDIPSRAPIGWLRDDIGFFTNYLSQGSAGMEEGDRKQQVGGMAVSGSEARATRALRHCSSQTQAPSAMSSTLTASKTR